MFRSINLNPIFQAERRQQRTALNRRFHLLTTFFFLVLVAGTGLALSTYYGLPIYGDAYQLSQMEVEMLRQSSFGLLSGFELGLFYCIISSSMVSHQFEPYFFSACACICFYPGLTAAILFAAEHIAVRQRATPPA